MIPEKCPKCGNEDLDLVGDGAYWYGRYEFYIWKCKKCGFDEFDAVEELIENDRTKKENEKNGLLL